MPKNKFQDAVFTMIIATILFKDTKSFGMWLQTWGMNFPMAILYQMFYCGPLVRLIFRLIFHEKKEAAQEKISTEAQECLDD